MMKPYLVNSIEVDGKAIEEFQPTVLEQQICKPEVVNAAKECMKAVVAIGTGKPAFENTPFPVAGKTGTAHVADGKIKYGDGVYQATFVGYFPVERPQYTCIVVIRTKPHAFLHFGGQVAAPVFREIATKLYAMYVDKRNPSNYVVVKDSAAYFYAGNSKDIKAVFSKMNMGYRDSVMQNTWTDVYAQNGNTVMKGMSVKPKLMPNVKGMGLKDALYLLENAGVKVIAKGKGKVMNQSVPAGTPLTKGFTVVVELG
jgi:cell division protein FtsI (penicillin-binding protein 3)